MKQLNNYIIEKLHLNKDINIKETDLVKVFLNICNIDENFLEDEFKYFVETIQKHFNTNKVTGFTVYISGNDENIIKSIPEEYIDDYIIIDEEKYSDISFKISENGYYIYDNSVIGLIIKGALGKYMEVSSSEDESPEPIYFEFEN